MLTEEKGRFRTVRTDDERDATLAKMLGSMTEEERETLKRILTDPEAANLISRMADLDYDTKPVDVRSFFTEDYYLGRIGKNLWPKWLDDIEEAVEGDYEEVVFCLHPDTPVPLLNGTEKTIIELANRWEAERKPFWVYSVVGERAVPALATNPHKTGEDDYYKVILDDGTSFICNARHQMIMRTGEKRMTMDFRAGDSLMPFRTSVSSRTKRRRISGYELVFDPETEKEKYTHALVADHVFGSIDPKKLTIHHLNLNKRDNEPKNLTLMLWKEHHAFHVRHRKELLDANPGVRDRLVERQRAAFKDPSSPVRVAQMEFMRSAAGRRLAVSNLSKHVPSAEERERGGRKACELRWNGDGNGARRAIASERMRNRNLAGLAVEAGRAWKNRSQEEKDRCVAALVARNMEGRLRRTDVVVSSILDVVSRGSKTVAAAARAFGCSTTRIKRAFADEGKDFKEVFTRRRNHTVVSVECVGHGPVYCMTVEATGNFAICTRAADGSFGRNGVFSSNTGAIGTGKSYSAACLMAYLFYGVSCLRDPQESYGIDPTSFLSFACIGVNLRLARRGIFAEITSKIEASPYFEDRFPQHKLSFEAIYPKKVSLLVGSTASNAILGLNVFGGVIDEANFFGQSKSNNRAMYNKWGIVDRVAIIYNSIKRRMESRFMKVGKLPGLLIIDSSSTIMSSFTMQKIAEARDNPKIMVRDYATFDVKPSHYFTGVYFKVAVGNERVRHKIVEDEEEFGYLESLGARIFDVPEEYRDAFVRDIDGSIMDILGVSISPVSIFISNATAIFDCVDRHRSHPMDVEEYLCGSGGKFFWSRMCQEQMTVTRGITETRNRPIVNPDEVRHVHFDLSKTQDSTGVVVAHVDRYVEVPRIGGDGKEKTEMAPVIYVDLALRVLPRVGGEIMLAELRSLIYEMMDHGYLFGYASADRYQSQDMIQQLGAKGIETEVLSVDETMTPYETLKQAIYEHRVAMYPYQPLLDELTSLQRVMKGGKFKVDHPTDPKVGMCSKDVADALAAVAFSLTYKKSQSMTPYRQVIEVDGKKRKARLPFITGDEE